MRAYTLAVALLLVSGWAHAKDYAKQMQFQLFRPCTGNAALCGPMLLASGEVDDGAPERLKKLLQGMNASPRVVFDSPGGNLVAGIELGEVIRRFGLNTALGTQYSEETPAGMVVIASDIGCYSACAYAFMGGVSRFVLDGAKFGVHQFYGAREDHQAVTQVAVAVLSQYMKRMGVDRDLLDIASLTSSDEMTEISKADAVLYNLDNTMPSLASWQIQPLDDGDMAVVTVQQRPGSDSQTVVGLALLDTDKTQLAVVVRVKDIITRRSHDQIPNYLPEDGEHATICAGNKKCALLTPRVPWSYDSSDMSIMAIYTTSLEDLVSVVVDEAPLRIEAGFPAVAEDLDPSVQLGREGLRPAMLSLLKRSL